MFLSWIRLIGISFLFWTICACASIPPMSPERNDPVPRPLPPVVRQALASYDPGIPLIVVRFKDPQGRPAYQILRGNIFGSPNQRRTLRPADWLWVELDWYMYPSGGVYTFGTADTLEWEIEFWCTDGYGIYTYDTARIDSMPVTPQVGTGSHGTSHSPTTKPVGAWHPNSGFTDSNGIFLTKYSIPIASGDESHIIYAYLPEQGHPVCDDDVSVVFPYYAAVRVPDLVEVDEVLHDAIVSDHTSVYYATAEVRDLTYEVRDLWRDGPYSLDTAFRLNAASLPYGGINDINKNWSNPHLEHRMGTDVDIDTYTPDEVYLDELRRMGISAGFAACIIEDPKRDHVHCRAYAY